MESDTSAETFSVTIHNRIGALPGYQYGFRHPSMTIAFTVKGPADPLWINEIDTDLDRLIAETGTVIERRSKNSAADPANGIAAILRWTFELQQAARLPVFEPGRIIGVSPDRETVLTVVTTFNNAYQATVGLVRSLTRVLNAGSRRGERVEALRALPDQLDKLNGLRINPSTTQFLDAAHAAVLPASLLIPNIYQFGQGIRGRWIDGAMNGKTSALGVHLARQKDVTAHLLRKAGIPTPDQVRVSTVDEAVEAAERLGYPVVVKPLDLDRGIAVATFLQTAPKVRAAFSDVIRHSPNVLVERHIPGEDFRLVVFEGELVAAIRRVPGGVTGDGISTIKTLLDRLNGDPRRSSRPDAILKTVPLDHEALTVLGRSGRTPETVPDLDEFVQLRYAANVATGGMPVDVLASVHPDNRLLAVRATAALNLDLGGVDLIIPDIARSWRETGAAICEVNAVPNLGIITTRHLFPLLLRRMVPGNGRVPIVVVLGAAVGSCLVATIARRLTEEGLLVGWADRTGVTIGQDRVVVGPHKTFDRGQMLVFDRTVEAIVLGIDHVDVRSTGLPFARFDVLVLAGDQLDGLDVSDAGARQREFERLFGMVRPACDGFVLRSIDGSMLRSQRTRTAEGLDDDRLIDRVVTIVMDEDMSRKHASSLEAGHV